MFFSLYTLISIHPRFLPAIKFSKTIKKWKFKLFKNKYFSMSSSFFLKNKSNDNNKKKKLPISLKKNLTIINNNAVWLKKRIIKLILIIKYI